ncbi:MAG: ABC transporter substrate-binding protein [Bacilli bacterium]|nr:ABC transporter substrate-binding protein [Bacilli bacterium]
MDFKNFKFIFVGFVILIAIFAIVQMTSKNNKKQIDETQSSTVISYKDNIRLGISNFDTVNPLTTKNKQLIDIEQLVYEPLFNLNAEYKLTPCLATEYAKTSDTTYIVKINNSIKWSNGTNLTANDVEFTVNLLKSIDSLYSNNVQNISSVEVIDDSTVKFNLSEETYLFEYNLIFPIMCESYYIDENFFESEKYPIGTGMYKLASVSSNQILLEKNDNYRNQDEANKNIKNIFINIFSEVGEVYNSFKIGNIDVLNTSSLSYKDYIGTMGYYIKEYKGREYDFLSFNCNDYLMKEKSVRQAISLAIDKENIVSTVYNNKCYTSEYALDFGSFAYPNNSASSGYNPEKAKEVLINDGWIYTNNRWRKNGIILAVTISVSASNNERCEVAKSIKEQLESIGIPVTIWQISDYQYNYCLNYKNYQILLTGVYNSYSPELTYFYGENNIANYNNEEVRGLIDDIKNITDEKVLLEKYQSLINITKDDCAYVSLYRNKNSLLVNQDIVANFEPNNFGVFRNFGSWNRE